jgi:hypothetical protein
MAESASMIARRVTLVAGLVGGLGWLTKVALIWGNGGTNTDQGVVAVFYVVGLLGLVVAFAAAGAWLTAGRPVWQRALAVVVGLVTFFLTLAALDAVLAPVAPDDHWFAEEVEIVAMGLVGLLVGLWAGAAARTRANAAV